MSSNTNTLSEAASWNEQGKRQMEQGNYRGALRAFAFAFRSYRVAAAASSSSSMNPPAATAAAAATAPFLLQSIEDTLKEHSFRQPTADTLSSSSCPEDVCRSLLSRFPRIVGGSAIPFLNPLPIPAILLKDDSNANNISTMLVGILLMLNGGMANHMIAMQLVLASTTARSGGAGTLRPPSKKYKSKAEEVFLQKAIQLYQSARDMYCRLKKVQDASTVPITVGESALCPLLEVVFCANFAQAYELFGQMEITGRCYQRLVCLIRSLQQEASSKSSTITRPLPLSRVPMTFATAMQEETENAIFDRLIKQAALHFHNFHSRTRERVAAAA